MMVAERVLAEAESWIGTPYRHGASMRGVSCDCLGLVRGIWRALYGNEPEHPGLMHLTGRRPLPAIRLWKPRKGI